MFDALLGKAGDGKHFTPVERAVLYAIGKLLEEPFASLYKEQLSLINDVQRLCDGKECNFYMSKMFQLVQLPKRLELPKLAREYVLGVVTLQHRESKIATRAKVYVVNGRVFSVTFERAPNFLNQNFKVIDAVLLNRPDAHKITSPLPPDTVLPAEYFELLRDGRHHVNGWKLMAEEEIREVVQEYENFCVFAEKEEFGVVGVLAGDKSGKPLYVNFEDCSRMIDIDGSLTNFFESEQINVP